MERKTKVHAEDGKQELVITRKFDLPVEPLFNAHVEPEPVSSVSMQSIGQLTTDILILRLPFDQGMNRVHDRLKDIVNRLK